MHQKWWKFGENKAHLPTFVSLTNKVKKIVSCLRQEKDHFFEEETNLPCILANLIVDLSQTETAKWAPLLSLLSCTFLEEIYNLQIFVAAVHYDNNFV